MPQRLRSFLLFSLFSITIFISASAQAPILKLDTTMFSPDQQINLSSVKEWRFRPGHNPEWSRADLLTKDWQSRKLSDLSIKDTDKEGKAEGWYRLRIQLDPTFAGMPVFFRKSGWAAADLYVDGQWIASFGSTGRRGKPYQHYYFLNQHPLKVNLQTDSVHVIALHVVDYGSPINPGKLKSQVGIDPQVSFRLVGIRYQTWIENMLPALALLTLFRLTVSLLVSFLLWLVWAQKLGNSEKGLIRLLAHPRLDRRPGFKCCLSGHDPHFVFSLPGFTL